MPARSRLLLTLLVAAGCAGTTTSGAGTTTATRQPEVKRQGPLRVMTFNIRYGTAPDGDDAWPIRRSLALRVIGDFGPAVLGLQEALRFQLDELERALPAYGEVGVGRDDGVQAGEYAAILYDRSRLRLLADGRFWLSDTPTVPGSMTWGNRYPRIVTWARFEDRATSQTFSVFNTHWDHESQLARDNSARLMRERIAAAVRDHQDAVLLLGDLNCDDGNPAFRTLTGSPVTPFELVDTFRLLHGPVAGVGTFHAFHGTRDGSKIDFILVSPLSADVRPPPGKGASAWSVLDADIIHTSDGGHYPSDHFPVTATLLLSEVRKFGSDDALTDFLDQLASGLSLEERSHDQHGIEDRIVRRVRRTVLVLGARLDAGGSRRVRAGSRGRLRHGWRRRDHARFRRGDHARLRR